MWNSLGYVSAHKYRHLLLLNRVAPPHFASRLAAETTDRETDSPERQTDIQRLLYPLLTVSSAVERSLYIALQLLTYIRFQRLLLLLVLCLCFGKPHSRKIQTMFVFTLFYASLQAQKTPRDRRERGTERGSNDVIYFHIRDTAIFVCGRQNPISCLEAIIIIFGAVIISIDGQEKNGPSKL